ncbi:DUF2273 domain-containing protein [Caldisericum sp. AR60]|uniref:DUF2273 domain-containing protein n=1 Tax=Caldisericum sp. AR60 TaxID=3397852 RepID=UPI0039FCB81E
MQRIAQIFIYLSEEHPAKLIGVTVGLVFGIFTAIWGLLKALFILICIIAGYLIGEYIDKNKRFRGFL